MLNRVILKNNPDILKKKLKDRFVDADIDMLVKLDEKIRDTKKKLDGILSKRNKLSKEIGKKKFKGLTTQELENEVLEINKEISYLEDLLDKLDSSFISEWLLIPNLIDDSVPIGKDESDNKEIKRWKEPVTFDFIPKDHVELALELGLLDFERASKLSGSRFVVYTGKGAKLERALINFMLDLHTIKHGYREVFPPYLVNEEIMVGTGQLPKFENDAYRVDGQYLIPTAEVPLVNLHRNEILSADDLPIKYVAYTACFRKEAGSYGKDVRGIIRQHQFNKVELVQFVKPENSYEILGELTLHAEEVLKQLGLPYRVVVLCSGDTGFSAAKTYDIEVWLPSQNKYREISSCSNTSDFQARRSNIRYKANKKNLFVHILNGSGVAVGRLLVAILENYQTKDGNIIIPDNLVSYFGSDRIKK